MMLNNIIVWVSLACIMSIVINIILFVYSRRVLLRIFNASEIASEIFTRLDAFEEHLVSIYETPTFYGDETLQGLLDHSKSLTTYLGQYEEIYSFTQPDLMEQLHIASEELLKKEDEEEKNPQKEE